MGEKNLYDYWSGNWKTHNMEWNMAMARAVLDAWQLKFSEVGGLLLRAWLCFMYGYTPE